MTSTAAASVAGPLDAAGALADALQSGFAAQCADQRARARKETARR
jgi:hypothetical protein